MFSVDVVKLVEKLLAALRRRFSSTPTCPGPQLLRFYAYVGADKSGKLDELASERYGSYDVAGCYGLYVQGKDAMDNDWYTIDEILEVIKWIASGWYEGESTSRLNIYDLDTGTALVTYEPYGKYNLEKRTMQIPVQESEPFSDLPRLVKISTPNTYSSSHPNAYIPIRIETRDDVDRQWNTSPGDADYWLNVLEWIQDGLYNIKDIRCQLSCVFERV